MPDPLVSIVMPVYNQVKYVADSICSVLRQTVTDFELIIVDDGSLDGSLEICETYAGMDSRIRLNKRSHNGGQAVATNDGCKVARGKYMAWHHSDDNYRPQFLEWTLEAASKGYEVVYGQQHHMSLDGEVGEGPFPGEVIWDFNKLKTQCYLSCGGMLYTRAAYEEVGGYDETFITCVDWDFSLRVTKGRNVKVLDKVVYYYRDTHAYSNRSKIAESVRNQDRKRIRQGNYG